MRWKDRTIYVGILGAGRHIGKSCHAVRLGKNLILIDAGTDPSVAFIPENKSLFMPLLRGENGQIGLHEIMTGVTKVILVLTHAHHDHVGSAIPVFDEIQKHYPRVTIQTLATAPTWKFCGISWMESVNAMKRAPWTKSNALFEDDDILRMGSLATVAQFGETYEIDTGISLMLVPAGHILGAASVYIEAWGEIIAHTGDIAFDDFHLVPGAMRLNLKPKVLLNDGTYVGECGERRDIAEHRCVQRAFEVLNRGGIGLFAAYQIDRGQELAEILSRAGVPFLIDGGIRKMCAVYKEFLGKDYSEYFMRGVAERHEILEQARSGIVIASGGMVKGAALEWAKGIAHREDSAIFLTGWTDPCSPGRQLYNMLQIQDDSVARELNIEDKDGKELRVPIKCEIDFFHLSGHAHGNQLETFWDETRPENLVLIHTEGQRTKQYIKNNRGRIMAPHVFLPRNGDVLEF